MNMYFGIKLNKWKSDEIEEFSKTKEYLLTFPFEPTENSSILKLNLKDLRKLKIQSLNDKKIKKDLEQLQKLLNDNTKIEVYGDKMPIIESMSTGTAGSSSYKKSVISKEKINYYFTLNEIFDCEEIIVEEEN